MGGVRVAVTSTDNALRIINTATMKEDWTLKALCVSSRKDSVLKRHFNKDGTLRKAGASSSSASVPSSSSKNAAATGTEAAAPTTSSSNNNVVSYAQLQYLQSDRNWNCTLKLEPRSEHVVCNGYPGQLQVFSPSSKSISNSFQVQCVSLHLCSGCLIYFPLRLSISLVSVRRRPIPRCMCPPSLTLSLSPTTLLLVPPTLTPTPPLNSSTA